MAKKAAKSTEALTRDDAACRAILAITGTTTLTELTAKADAAFVAGAEGRESNPTMQKQALRRALGTLEAVGLIRQTKPTDVIVEKVKK